MSADLVARLIAAGTPIDLVGEVAMALARLEAERDSAATADRRSSDAIKQQRYRDRLKERDVTKGNDVTETVTRDAVGNAAPALDKRNPQTPKKINPTPCVDTPAREAEPEVLVLARLNAAQVAIALVLTGLHKRRWKTMPPPAGVSAVQWQGFLDHRKALRKSLTDRAYQLLCDKLAKHDDPEWPPGRIVDHMTEHVWLSFKPEWLPRKSEPRNGNRSQHHTRPSAWAPAPGLDGFEPASLDD